MGKFKTLISKLKNNPGKLVGMLGNKELLNWIPDKRYLKMIYYCETGRKLNLDNPKRYNEKIQWRKIYDRKPEYSKYVDKYAVRSYISETIGEQYIIPLLAVYDRVEEIDWHTLPNKFVLKCTHGSGCNIICKDKSKLDIETSKIKLNKWMKKSWYWFGREWPYKDVKPRIICEEFISDTDKEPKDYKIMCFNGKPTLIQVHDDRFRENHKLAYYDIKGKLMPFNCRGYRSLEKEDLNIDKVKLSEMVELAKILSKGFIEIRVDLYLVNNKIYFGELTFFDASGFGNEFVPDKYNEIFGDMIDLGI